MLVGQTLTPEGVGLIRLDSFGDPGLPIDGEWPNKDNLADFPLN